MQIKLLWDMNVQAPARIGIPKIGAGLAGGDWGRIEQIIDNIGFSDITTVIYTG
jgi:O-acetyl-ADP-ribose deacetylase (regulator of RNase III)